MDNRIPHPRQKGSHNQFHNQRPQRFGNAQLFRPNISSHPSGSNYEENYAQSPQLIVQTQDWQPPYSSPYPSGYVSPPCGSPVSQNAPAMSAVYAAPQMPSSMYNAPPQIQEGNIIINSSVYTPQQLINYCDFLCSFCKTYNVYWKLYCDEKLKIICDKDVEIAELNAKIERLEEELQKEKNLMKSSEILNNNVDDKKQMERTINQSQLSVHAPEFNYLHNDFQVPVVSANGDFTEKTNSATEEYNLRVKNSVHTSDEHISESVSLTDTRGEEYTCVNSLDIKSDLTSSNSNDLSDLSNYVSEEARDQIVNKTPQQSIETVRVEQHISELKIDDIDKETSSAVDMDNQNTNVWKQPPHKKRVQDKQQQQQQRQQSTEIKQRATSQNAQTNLSRKNSEDGAASYRNSTWGKEVRSTEEAKTLPCTESQTDMRDEACNNQLNSEKYVAKKKFSESYTDPNKKKKSYRGRNEEPPVSSHSHFPPLGQGVKNDDQRQDQRRKHENQESQPRSNSKSKQSEREAIQSSSHHPSSSEHFSGNNYNSQDHRGKGDRRGGGGYRRSEQDKFPRRREILTEITGDLFSTPENFSLAHCVGSDFRMGRGIAVTFKQNFKGVGELMNQNAKVGEVAFLKEGERYIFYLVTKKFSSGKPTYDDFKKTLEDLMAKCVEFEVKHLAMPRIGCGLDKLDWKQVRVMIKEVFGGVNIEIVVYNFEDGIQEKDYKGLPGKDKKSAPLRSGPIYQESFKPLVEIPSQTALVFLGTVDGHMDRTAESLDRKFHFASSYKSEKKALGDTVRFLKNNEVIFSLIVQETADGPFNFGVLEICLNKLNKHLRTDKFSYVGFEAFNDPDDILVPKIISMFRSVLYNYMELWICWPQDVVNVEKESSKRQQHSSFS